jgi:hypothetical protein
MAPLLERHRELVQQSVRRKAGALRDAVTAALRSKLGAVGTTATAITTPLEEIERRLRMAAGEIEEARQFCLAATDDVRSLNELALQRSVQAIVESWDDHSQVPPSGVGMIRHAAETLAAEAASQISGRLTALAQHLQSALALATEALPLQDQSSIQDDQMEDCVREMPRFEAALPEIEIAPPWYYSFEGLARPWVTRTLRRSVLLGLQTGFTNYGRALEIWVRRVLSDLQRRFDALADTHRARLARFMNRKGLSAEERVRMESHLAEMEALVASPVKN